MVSSTDRPTLLTSLLLIALAASCGRTSNHEGQSTSQSGGAAAGVASTAEGGAAPHAGSTAETGGTPPNMSSAGTPEISEPSTASRPCQSGDVPDAPCEDSRCWGTRCGVRFDLVCQHGAWSSADSPLAWELVCPVVDEAIYDVGNIEIGACCGDVLPKNNYSDPPSCNLCPEGAPQDGSPCSLPDECTPPIVDCFYKCCCYGNTIWAQCDGERWRVATNCTGK